MYSARSIRFALRALPILEIFRDVDFHATQSKCVAERDEHERQSWIQRLMFVRNVDPLARLRNTVGKVGSRDCRLRTNDCPDCILLRICHKAALDLVAL